MRRGARLCILGSNSGRNAGDAAILSSIVDNSYTLNRELSYEVPTSNCAFVRRLFPDKPVKPVSIMPWTGSIRFLGISTVASILRSDAVLITDGIIFDIRLFNPLFNFLILLACIIPFARLCGRKILCFCVGVGPLDTAPGRVLARMVCNLCDAVMVREQSSYDLLLDVGVRKELLEIYADAAFVNQPSPEETGGEVLNEIGCPASGKIVGINVNTYIDMWLRASSSLNREEFTTEFASAVDAVIERAGVRVVFTITQIMDIRIADEIMGRMRHRDSASLLSNRDYSHHAIMAAMGGMQLFVGMRLHSLILSSAMYVPVLGLAYAPKVRHFMKMLGMEDMIFELDEITGDRLASAIVNAWHVRDETARRMKPVIDEVKERVREAFRQADNRYYRRGRHTS
jgi:polysaccharide pyruvyl transferase WcaK-like protein